MLTQRSAPRHPYGVVSALEYLLMKSINLFLDRFLSFFSNVMASSRDVFWMLRTVLQGTKGEVDFS